MPWFSTVYLDDPKIEKQKTGDGKHFLLRHSYPRSSYFDVYLTNGKARLYSGIHIKHLSLHAYRSQVILRQLLDCTFQKSKATVDKNGDTIDNKTIWFDGYEDSCEFVANIVDPSNTGVDDFDGRAPRSVIDPLEMHRLGFEGWD